MRDTNIETEIDRRNRVRDEIRREPGRIPDGARESDFAGCMRVVLPPNFTVADFFAASNMLAPRRERYSP